MLPWALEDARIASRSRGESSIPGSFAPMLPLTLNNPEIAPCLRGADFQVSFHVSLIVYKVCLVMSNPWAVLWSHAAGRLAMLFTK